MSSNENSELSDMDDSCSEGEKELLENVRKGRKRPENGKNELLRFNDSSDDDDDDDNSVEGEDAMNDGDPMNWGQNRRTYYNTDFVDKDYNSYNAQEEELAKAEENEAKNIQLRLAKQLSDADYCLGSIDTAEVSADEEDAAHGAKQLTQSIHVATDLSGLLQNERLQLFLKDSPEFNGLIKDFKKFLDEINKLLWPVLEYNLLHKLPAIPALKFASVYKNILMTFCSNVSVYLLLKAKRVVIKNHPIIKRLVQLKRLVEQLHDKYINIIEPQLEALLERIQNGDKFDIKLPTTATKKQERKQNKMRLAKSNARDETEDVGDSSGDEEIDETEIMEEEEESGDLRRGITYQIAKNKGLIPQRKKEQRNPRVKHRGKYRKALIRRKGAVRTVLKKVQHYGGEVSGIKATVSKSIKFKT